MWAPAKKNTIKQHTSSCLGGSQPSILLCYVYVYLAYGWVSPFKPLKVRLVAGIRRTKHLFISQQTCGSPRNRMLFPKWFPFDPTPPPPKKKKRYPQKNTYPNEGAFLLRRTFVTDALSNKKQTRPAEVHFFSTLAMLPAGVLGTHHLRAAAAWLRPQISENFVGQLSQLTL